MKKNLKNYKKVKAPTQARVSEDDLVNLAIDRKLYGSKRLTLATTICNARIIVGDKEFFQTDLHLASHLRRLTKLSKILGKEVKILRESHDEPQWSSNTPDMWLGGYCSEDLDLFVDSPWKKEFDRTLEALKLKPHKKFKWIKEPIEFQNVMPGFIRHSEDQNSNWQRDHGVRKTTLLDIYGDFNAWLAYSPFGLNKFTAGMYKNPRIFIPHIANNVKYKYKDIKNRLLHKLRDRF